MWYQFLIEMFLKFLKFPGDTMEKKRYIGDGVYVARAAYGFWLTTEDGISVTNEIFLEPEVLTGLLDFVEGAGVEDEV
jgi:hypothetical protein